MQRPSFREVLFLESGQELGVWVSGGCLPWGRSQRYGLGDGRLLELVGISAEIMEVHVCYPDGGSLFFVFKSGSRERFTLPDRRAGELFTYQMEDPEQAYEKDPRIVEALVSAFAYLLGRRG
jgi:hypothetical protein